MPLVSQTCLPGHSTYVSAEESGGSTPISRTFFGQLGPVGSNVNVPPVFGAKWSPFGTFYFFWDYTHISLPPCLPLFKLVSDPNCLLGTCLILTAYLGGLFTPEQREEEFFFRLAVHHINEDETILSRTKLVAQVKSVDYFDSFHANKQGKA